MVTIPGGMKGVVSSVNVLRQLVKVVVDNGEEKEMQEYKVDDLRFTPRRRKDVKLTEEELKELEGLEDSGETTIEEKPEHKSRNEGRTENRYDSRNENRNDSRNENRGKGDNRGGRRNNDRENRSYNRNRRDRRSNDGSRSYNDRREHDRNHGTETGSNDSQS